MPIMIKSTSSLAPKAHLSLKSAPSKASKERHSGIILDAAMPHLERHIRNISILPPELGTQRVSLTRLQPLR